MNRPDRLPWWVIALLVAFFGVVLPALLNIALAQSHQIAWHDARGLPIEVAVFDECAQKVNPRPYTFVDARQIYLCHDATHEAHEKAHMAGMRHTRWQENANGIACARVTAPDFDGHYRKDDLICSGPSRRGEWIER